MNDLGSYMLGAVAFLAIYAALNVLAWLACASIVDAWRAINAH